jgi:hypothetical protein
MLMGLLFASFLSPQLSYWGRGLKLSLPLFCFLTIHILISNKYNEYEFIEKRNKYIIVGLVFIADGFFRYLMHPVNSLKHNYIISCLICIFLWFTISLLRCQSIKTIETIRWICLLSIGVSIGLGIPLLIQKPGVARLTMGNPLERKFIALYFPKGIANYSLYTAIAIAWPVIANWLLNYKHKSILSKWIGWFLLFVSSIAVIFSTFTMAVILIISSIILWLILIIIKNNSNKMRIFGILLVIIILTIAPKIYNASLRASAVQFSSIKATRITENIISTGFLKGDETGRAKMLVNTLPTILKYPLLGAWGFDRSMYWGGHSSWGDFLALFGISGLILWIYFLSPSLKRGKKPFSISDGIAGGTLSWILVCIGGILNPTFNIAAILLLIWIFDNKEINKKEI